MGRRGWKRLRRTKIAPGGVFWAQPGPVVGREQTGRRPVVVVSGRGHLLAATTLCTVVSVTSVDRGWPNHVFLGAVGLNHPRWAMTEQVRTLSRRRFLHRAGALTPAVVDEIRMWMKDFLQLH